MKTIWLHTILLITLIAVSTACNVQVAPSIAAPTANTSPSVMSAISTDEEAALLLWEGSALFAEDQSECHRLLVTKDDQALTGPCDSEQTEAAFVTNHQGGLADMIARFAPFQADWPQGRITFNGAGDIAGPAWERALTSWAQFTYAELASGRVGAANRTVLAWQLGQENGQCRLLLVLGHGYATAGLTPCEGGQMQVIASDWVDTPDWEQFDAWLYTNAPFYQDNSYLDGRGTIEMSDGDAAALAEWAGRVYAKLVPSPGASNEISVALTLRQLLAQQLHLDIAAVRIVEVTENNWPDRCLGAPHADELCQPAETPGYRISLAVNDSHYRYHTDLAGQQMRLVEAPAPAIGQPILTWFGADETGCQTLEAGPAGVAFGHCGQALMGVSFSIDTRQADIVEFAGKYASFVTETPAGTVSFVGYGPNITTPAEQRMLAEWAKLVYLEAEFGRSGASWGLVLAWRREGGQSNFCDDVTVYATGDAYLATACQDTLPVDIGRIRLNAVELASVFEWVDALQPFEYNPDASAEGEATIQIVFSGAGSQAPTELDIGLISEFAQNLQFEASMQAVTPPAVCPTPQAGEQLLLNQEDGYCLLYPAEYSLAQPASGSIEIVKNTVMNHIDPRVSIHVEDTVGRTLDEVARQMEVDYVPQGFTMERRTIIVDGVEAIILDNLPGQDVNRRVAFIQNGQLHHFFFAPIGDAGSDVRQQAETLYQQVLDSFRFLEMK